MREYFVLKYIAITHQGRIRANNEDNFFINGLWKKDVGQSQFRTEGICNSGYMVASVCDGMGGQDFGEIASLLAVETWNEIYRWSKLKLKKAPFRNQSQACAEKANLRICEIMKKEKKQMGTTMTVLEFAQNKVVSVNLGDSPSFRLRDGKLLRMSEDHTVVQRMVRLGQITSEEAKTHPLRHHITQYLGIFPDDMELVPAQNDFGEIEKEDKYLICSDGLTDMLSENVITAVLQQKDELKQQAECLIQKALEAGGRDNITVVLIEVGETIDWKKMFMDNFKDKMQK